MSTTESIARKPLTTHHAVPESFRRVRIESRATVNGRPKSWTFTTCKTMAEAVKAVAWYDREGPDGGTNDLRHEHRCSCGHVGTYQLGTHRIYEGPVVTGRTCKACGVKTWFTATVEGDGYRVTTADKRPAR